MVEECGLVPSGFVPAGVSPVFPVWERHAKPRMETLLRPKASGWEHRSERLGRGGPIKQSWTLLGAQPPWKLFSRHRLVGESYLTGPTSAQAWLSAE